MNEALKVNRKKLYLVLSISLLIAIPSFIFLDEIVEFLSNLYNELTWRAH